MIEFADTDKRYGRRSAGVAALDGVSLRFDAGSVTAIVGPNGAGKSTLLGLVLGYVRPTSGTVSVAGMAPRDWVRSNGAAYLPERFSMPPEWTVRGGLRTLVRLENAGDDVGGRVDAAMSRFGLDAHASKRIGTLSRGLTQRLGMAQATLVARALVVLDEPTEGLDYDGRVLFRESVRGMRKSGATVLIASHDLAELERVTDRAVLLDGGRVRDTLEVRPPDVSDLVALRTLATEGTVLAAFPGATRIDADGQGDRWAVRTADAADLNARIATLIAAGGLVVEIGRVTPSLETAVRQAGAADTHDTESRNGESVDGE